MGIKLLILLVLVVCGFMVYSYITAPYIDEPDDTYYMSSKEKEDEKDE